MESKEAPKKMPLKQSEAEFRKAELSDEKGNVNVSYNLILTLRKTAHVSQMYPHNNFEGRLHLKFVYHGKVEEDLFLNFSGDVHSLVINSEKQETNYRDRRVYLDRTKLKKGQENDIVVLFSTKYDKGGVGLHHFTDPIDGREYMYTQFEPYECHLVFPVFDQPDIKAPLALTLVGPEDWVLLGNEYEKFSKRLNSDDSDIKNELKDLSEQERAFLLDSVIEHGYKIQPFKPTPKISSYLYAICAGPYHCITDKTNYKVPLRIFMRESLKGCAEPEEFFRITIAGMEWYKNFFGIAYPFNKYDQIYTPEYNFGAMENVGLVTYNELYCWKDTPTQQRRARFCITVLHELAHMWFGNLVTMKWWDDLWLNESFATFISFLCQEQAVGNEYNTSWLSFNSSKGFAYREDQKVTTHPVMAEITDTDKSQSHFDAIVYYKGSSLLKQMFYFIGQENFSNGLKSYFKQYAWGNTVFDDFVDKMVEALGENNKYDLKTLCKSWLTKSGLNQIELQWETEGDKIKTFNVVQTPTLSQHANLQTHMIDILFVYEDREEEHKNILIKSEENTHFPDLVGLAAPKAVILNYNDWGYLKWLVDKKSFDYLKDNLLKIKCNLTRQLFYRSLFDMTRDAKISCTEYLDVVNKLLEHETNDEILSITIRNISGLIANYLPPKCYPVYTDKMFKLVSKLIANNLKNKDLTLNLVEILIMFAHNEEHVLILKDWLVNGPYVINGETKVPLPTEQLNQDNRFSIAVLIHKLRNLTLEEKAKILEAEVERDKNSDRSVRARCRCRAALPDPAIKKEIWEKVINEPNSESLYNMKAYMSSFAWIDQLDLVEPYIKERFFEDAEKVRSNEHFYVDAFVLYCGPIYYVDLDTIIKLEKLAENNAKHDTFKRRLLELADDMRRFMKAQKLSEVYLSLLNKWEK